jgi:hypothetical protein
MLAAIVEEINARAGHHDIRCMHEIRQRLKNFRKLPAKKLLHTQKKFMDKGWTFHVGGRTELQFNVGLELLEGKRRLRHGVAFSFAPSRTLPGNEVITVLRPKVERLNEFLRVHPEEFRDLRMWHWRKEKGKSERSKRPDQLPSPIPRELVIKDVFIFLGQLQTVEAIDYETILGDFDRLLPLYEFVEDTSNFPTLTPAGTGFHFQPGCKASQARTTANVAGQQLDVDLRHNLLRKALHRALSRSFGAEAVGTERPNGIGGFIDVVVRQDWGYCFYEIKTALSARACIRQALAQLLEYSFWPKAQEARRLIIVGEPRLDDQASEYLLRLRQRFSLPVYYQQLNLKQAVLVPAELDL